jgi:putative ABC transport system substrate-binding protein
LGWTEGRNVRFDVFFAAGEAELARRYTAELISRAPDVILGNGGNVIAALQQQTKTIPIVFAQVVDPVNSGFVDSLAQPGGNITGFTSLDYGVGTKWVEILKEIAPQVKRIAVLRDPTIPAGSGQLGAIQAVAPTFGVEVIALDVRDAGTIERAVGTFSQQPNGGLIVLANPASTVHRDLIIGLVERQRLPAIYPYAYFVRSGGLISYGIDNSDLWRRAASYVDRILNGETPANLPVQQPTKYVLAINLKTAKALGLAVPPTLLNRADEVVE